jgi:hypothetical protein
MRSHNLHHFMVSLLSIAAALQQDYGDQRSKDSKYPATNCTPDGEDLKVSTHACKDLMSLPVGIHCFLFCNIEPISYSHRCIIGLNMPVIQS